MMGIAVRRQVFLVIEEPKFCEKIANISAEVESMIPKSANTVREYNIITKFGEQKQTLTENLHNHGPTYISP